MSYVTRLKPHSGVPKHLRGWESKLDEDGYMSVEGYDRESRPTYNSAGRRYFDAKYIKYPEGVSSNE